MTPLPHEPSDPVAADTAIVDPDSKGRPLEIKKSKGILRLLLVLAGGFLFLAGLIFSTSLFEAQGNVFAGIPNNAIGAFVFGPSKQLRESFNPFSSDLKNIDPALPTAIVVLSAPVETGILVHISSSEDLTKLATTNFSPTSSIAPIESNVVAIGSPSFLERMKQAPKIPLSIRVRLWAQMKFHDGVFLWGPDQELPFTIGKIDTKNGKTILTIPTNDSSAQFFTDLKTVTNNIAQEFYPIMHTIRLPDETTAQEIRVDNRENNIFYFREKDNNLRCFPPNKSNNLSIFSDYSGSEVAIASFLLKKDEIEICF